MKIQAVHRGAAAGKEVESLKQQQQQQEQVSEQETQGVKEEQGEEVVAFEGSAEEQAAAVKIQAVHRGAAARKEVESLKQIRQAPERDRE